MGNTSLHGKQSEAWEPGLTTNTAAASTKAPISNSIIARSGGRKGISPSALYHRITGTIILGLLWGSEIWWTGRVHILSQLGPVYNCLAHHITGLLSWTHPRFPLESRHTNARTASRRQLEKIWRQNTACRQ